MSPASRSILDNLRAVAAERERRHYEPDLAARVTAIKHYQQQRFTRTYADLLADPRHAPAARFFLDDVYGPGDFSNRDGQFARIVPALVRLFPKEIVATVDALSALHALSEALDTEMGAAVSRVPIGMSDYVAAWQRVARPESRARQIELLVEIGGSLDRYVRNPLLRQSLRLMRSPARAAHLGALQSFLERGFDTFRGMRGASDFLAIIRERETALAIQLFEVTSAALESNCRDWMP